MKVAICEDELSQAKIIRLYLSHLSEKYKITSVTYFADGETLFKAFESGIRFDLYLLDIDLPGMSGIDLGSVICSSQSNAAIIYITGYAQYITQAFRLPTTQYLLKPVKRKAFHRAVAQFYAETNRNKFLIHRDDKTVYSISFNEIVYVEFYYKRSIVHTFDACHETTVNLRFQKEQLNENSFIQTHQGYFVNPMHINYIHGLQIHCNNHEIVPISARRKRDVLQTFTQYLQRTYHSTET